MDLPMLLRTEPSSREPIDQRKKRLTGRGRTGRHGISSGDPFMCRFAINAASRNIIQTATRHCQSEVPADSVSDANTPSLGSGAESIFRSNTGTERSKQENSDGEIGLSVRTNLGMTQ
jgi:hypothetical protein